jgi:hypothetical protein
LAAALPVRAAKARLARRERLKKRAFMTVLSFMRTNIERLKPYVKE